MRLSSLWTHLNLQLPVKTHVKCYKRTESLCVGRSMLLSGIDPLYHQIISLHSSWFLLNLTYRSSCFCQMFDIYGGDLWPFTPLQRYVLCWSNRVWRPDESVSPGEESALWFQIDSWAGFQTTTHEVTWQIKWASSDRRSVGLIPALWSHHWTSLNLKMLRMLQHQWPQVPTGTVQCLQKCECDKHYDWRTLNKYKFSLRRVKRSEINDFEM